MVFFKINHFLIIGNVKKSVEGLGGSKWGVTPPPARTSSSLLLKSLPGPPGPFQVEEGGRVIRGEVRRLIST